MRYAALVTLAVAVFTSVSTAAMARDHHQKHWRDWNRNNQYGYNNPYGYNYNPNPYPNGVMAPNGSWVDGTIDSHGNPAWAGGYRGR